MKKSEKIKNYNKCIDFVNSILDVEEISPEQWKVYESFKNQYGYLPIRWTWNEVESVRFLRKLGKNEEIFNKMKSDGHSMEEWLVTPYYNYYEDDPYIKQFGWFNKRRK